jgi:hypothetical protein
LPGALVSGRYAQRHHNHIFTKVAHSSHRRTREPPEGSWSWPEYVVSASRFQKTHQMRADDNVQGCWWPTEVKAVNIHHVTPRNARNPAYFAVHLLSTRSGHRLTSCRCSIGPSLLSGAFVSGKYVTTPSQRHSRPGRSLITQMRHESRRKAGRASLNTWQSRRAFKSLGRCVLMIMIKVVGSRHR